MIDLSESKLMYIEPKEPGILMQDVLTNKAEVVWKACKAKEICWRGFHFCSCGARSGNQDYVTPCGRETNSLLVHYVCFHRSEIPDSELVKLEEEYRKIFSPLVTKESGI